MSDFRNGCGMHLKNEHKMLVAIGVMDDVEGIYCLKRTICYVFDRIPNLGVFGCSSVGEEFTSLN